MWIILSISDSITRPSQELT